MSQGAHLYQRIEDKLRQRQAQGLLRQLPAPLAGIDFCSNDYLGYARRFATEAASEAQRAPGATGSRLISGNSIQAEALEQRIAQFHQAEAALLYTSGYTANLGLLSCLLDRGDTYIYDELAHASLRDGIRLSAAHAFSFAHNDLDDLRKKISRARGQVCIVVESLYSMDGDVAPLREMVELAEETGAVLVVDEAHTLGVFGEKGEGLVAQLGLSPRVPLRVVTFGKALGTHGAAVLCGASLRQYLLNFSRAFIYTTALPPVTLSHIDRAYAALERGETAIHTLRERIAYYARLAERYPFLQPVMPGAVQSIAVPGNEAVRKLAHFLQQEGLAVMPILSPTVPAGSERIRICLHAFNTEAELDQLAEALHNHLA